MSKRHLKYKRIKEKIVFSLFGLAVVLPAAMPGILTGIILGVGRVAGKQHQSCLRLLLFSLCVYLHLSSVK